MYVQNMRKFAEKGLIDMTEKEIEPFTVEVLKRLDGVDRANAIRSWHKWIKEQRREDRKERRRIEQEIFRFKNPDYYKKKW